MNCALRKSSFSRICTIQLVSHWTWKHFNVFELSVPPWEPSSWKDKHLWWTLMALSSTLDNSIQQLLCTAFSMNAQVQGYECFNDYELIFSCDDFLTGVHFRVKRQNKNWKGLDDLEIMETSSVVVASCCTRDAVSAHRQQTVYRVALIGGASWSLTSEQLFSVCIALDHDHAAIYHPWINSTVITPL